MNDGLMTGIFLDQHEVRGSLVDGLAWANPCSICFLIQQPLSSCSYGGARQTTSVDLAKRSRELSQAHFQANGISTDNHRFIVMDVLSISSMLSEKA